MTLSRSSSDALLNVYLALSQYPILSSRIRAQMRKVMYQRGIASPQEFETRVRDMAIKSQIREGIDSQNSDEPEDLWELRLYRTRDMMTDLIFSRHFSFEEFDDVLTEVLTARGVHPETGMLALNPELAPLDMVFDQAVSIERMPAHEREDYKPRLLESKVVLIRGMISDQLKYINIAKEWFKVSDLLEIRRRKIGAGRIGGKAAGMLLAARILTETADPALNAMIAIPESYFIGATEFYPFMSMNNLMHWIDQKYKTEEEMRADFPHIVEAFEGGDFPPDIVEKLQALLNNIGSKPLIVRSSSLLEDNFGTAFAGKYDSVFLPNQGTPESNLLDLKRGIAHIYASALNPNALLYRRQRGLQDYDERMAILIQVVEGEVFRDYYMPHAAGVGFSSNMYRWSPQIKRKDGFLRLVWGLGTRAVDRVGNDFPRLVALSHPGLRPSNNPVNVRKYSQQYIDLIDIKENVFKTLAVKDVDWKGYKPLRYLVQMDQEGSLVSLRSNLIDCEPENLIATFDDLLTRTQFSDCMRQVLSKLEKAYGEPVDLEFALHIEPTGERLPKLKIIILQCRPQSRLEDIPCAKIPVDLKQDQIIFQTHFVVPKGFIDQVDYVVYVPHEEYYQLPSEACRRELVQAIGKLNARLDKEQFICAGPGRWGSSNSDLGVPVDYGDIYNARSLVEIAGKLVGAEPEPSLGTHFFQDLLEAQIYPLALQIDSPDTVLRREFFYDTPNHLHEFLEVSDRIKNSLRLIKVSDYRPGTFLRIVMDDEESNAVAFLASE